VDITRESIKEIFGNKVTFGKIKNFEAFVKKIRLKYEPEQIQLTSTPGTTCSLNELNFTTPTTPVATNKKWPFTFKYPDYRIKDDPLFDKLSIPELELKSGDLTKIVVALFHEMRTYGDSL
jgi:hypothetical protein